MLIHLDRKLVCPKTLPTSDVSGTHGIGNKRKHEGRSKLNEQAAHPPSMPTSATLPPLNQPCLMRNSTDKENFEPILQIT